MEASESASNVPPRCPVCNVAITAEEPSQAASVQDSTPASDENDTRFVRCQRCQCGLRLEPNGEVMIQLGFTPLPRIISELEEWCTHDGQKTLLLDFEDVRFLDSMGLSQLMALQRFKQCHVILCHLAPEVEEVFRITSLHRVFELRT